MNPFARLALAVALTAPAATAHASFKDFRDWLAACDNLRNCSAFAVNADSGDAAAYLRIDRGGAADAPVIVTLSVELRDAKGYTVAFDDSSLPGLPAGTLVGEEGEANDYRRTEIAKGPAADALIASIRKAKAIVVTRQFADGKTSDYTVTRISMSGATASLLWIDDQQKRLDTVTALVRRGPKPASAVPPQPKAPIIVAAKPSKAKMPENHSPALLAKGRKLCDDNDENSQIEDVNPLGGGQFLYQFTCPDSSGAYNFWNVFLIGPAGNVNALRPVTFRRPPGVSDGDKDEPRSGQMNPSFDSETMTLTSFNKGRGYGDCGIEEQWVWTGQSFQLALQRSMGECKRIPMDDWPVTWRAEVKR
ncbi:MAG: DUF1176 domain-containing protein [Pseudomonadota bacterium]